MRMQGIVTLIFALFPNAKNLRLYFHKYSFIDSQIMEYFRFRSLLCDLRFRDLHLTDFHEFAVPALPFTLDPMESLIGTQAYL